MTNHACGELGSQIYRYKRLFREKPVVHRSRGWERLTHPWGTCLCKERLAMLRTGGGVSGSDKKDLDFSPNAIWVFPKIGVPQNRWFIMENPIKMDDLEIPLVLETPIYTYIYIYIYTGLGAFSRPSLQVTMASEAGSKRDPLLNVKSSWCFFPDKGQVASHFVLKKHLHTFFF